GERERDVPAMTAPFNEHARPPITTGDSLDDRSALLRRDEKRRIRHREDVVLFPGTREKIVTGAQLDLPNAYDAGQPHHLRRSVVGVAREARSFGQSHDRRPATGLVVPEQAPVDAWIVGRLPFPFCGLVHKHRYLLRMAASWAVSASALVLDLRDDIRGRVGRESGFVGGKTFLEELAAQNRAVGDVN